MSQEGVQITVDGKTVLARDGEKVLFAARRAGIFIPSLCYLEEIDDSFASCRLCFVEVEGIPQPVTSCTEPVRRGMVVRTDSERARRLQRSALRLLISAHRIDCKRCYANRRCALQDLARRLNVGLKISRLKDVSAEDPVDTTLASIHYDPGKCVLCGRCVRLKQLSGGTATFHFAFRGLSTRISTYTSGSLSEEAAQRYIERCPVGALVPPCISPSTGGRRC